MNDEPSHHRPTYATRIGETCSYWDPDAAANVAAYAVSIGGLGKLGFLPTLLGVRMNKIGASREGR